MFKSGKICWNMVPFSLALWKPGEADVDGVVTEGARGQARLGRAGLGADLIKKGPPQLGPPTTYTGGKTNGGPITMLCRGFQHHFLAGQMYLYWCA